MFSNLHALIHKRKNYDNCDLPLMCALYFGSINTITMKTKRTACRQTSGDRSENETKRSPQCRQDKTKRNIVLTLSTTRRKRPDCQKILEERSEAKGIGPILSKSKLKRIGVFQKFVKMKQNEVKSFKIFQDRSKTNIFVSNCVGGEKRKKLIFVFLEQSEEKRI